jgi:hypothetical protein
MLTNYLCVQSKLHPKLDCLQLHYLLRESVMEIVWIVMIQPLAIIRLSVTAAQESNI